MIAICDRSVGEVDFGDQFPDHDSPECLHPIAKESRKVILRWIAAFRSSAIFVGGIPVVHDDNHFLCLRSAGSKETARVPMDRVVHDEIDSALAAPSSLVFPGAML